MSAKCSRRQENHRSRATLKRPVLFVWECARQLRISERHVIDLIEEGKLRALNIAGANATDRKFYRIPVEALEAFLDRRSTI